MMKLKPVVAALFISTTLTACGGGGGGSSDSVVISDDTGGVPSVNYAEYKTVTNAQDLINNTDTSGVSVGIFDSGFRTDHDEFSTKGVTKLNYDEYAINTNVESGLYTGETVSWEWAEHGTHVGSLAAGSTVGMAPQAEVISAANFWTASTNFYQQEYLDTITVDSYGFVSGETRCNFNYSFNSWCIDNVTYNNLKIKEAASYTMPAINMSFSEAFHTAYQLGFDATFDQAAVDDSSYYTNMADAALPDTYNFSYTYNVTYNAMLELMNEGETTLVWASGNDAASLTQDLVLPFQDYMENSNYAYKDSLVHFLFDNDNDDNGNGVIEASERGITDGILMVGALDEYGSLAWYSNYPGSSVEAQARFIVAPGNTTSAASYGVDSYLYGTGTSYAAPVVTGAIALLKSKYPTFSSHEIVDAILATANKDIIDYAPETHGQGMLDVAAADALLATM